MSLDQDQVLDQLCRERYGRMVALATLITGSRDDASEVVQDALVASFGRRAKFASIAQAETYVRQAIAHRAVDRLRKSTTRRAGERRYASLRDTRVSDYEPVDTALMHALGGLPPRERASVVLRFLEDLSTAQTAAALGVSEGAVKRYVADGISSLRQTLGEFGGPQEVTRVSVFERRSRDELA